LSVMMVAVIFIRMVLLATQGDEKLECTAPS